MKALRQFLLEWVQQVGIALDQLLNATIGPFLTFTIGWADETVSARAGRNYLANRVMARIFKPVIDLMFFWQKPDPSITDEQGQPERSHCVRAYRKEILRRQLPPEYRDFRERQ